MVIYLVIDIVWLWKSESDDFVLFKDGLDERNGENRKLILNLSPMLYHCSTKFVVTCRFLLSFTGHELKCECILHYNAQTQYSSNKYTKRVPVRVVHA